MSVQYESFSAAVGLKKPIYKGDGNECRWMDDGEIITLSINKRNANNIEFCINDSMNNYIWFSQLATAFFHLEKFYFLAGVVKFKNGEIRRFMDYDPYQFADEVKDKQFKVIVNPHGSVAKFKRYPCATYEENAAFIKKLVDQGDWEQAAGYLLPVSEYVLEEV